MEPSVTFNDLSSFEGQIRVCEMYDDLSLYHYKSADENTSPLLKQVRGIVFNKNGKLIMRGFPYTPEYLHNDPELFKKIGQLNDCTCILSFEGTILRVFNHNDKWYVSTHKKLFASQSYWANRHMSFEQQFQAAIELNLSLPESPLKLYMQQRGQSEFNYEMFFNSLDKNKQYMFLINPLFENRVVAFNGTAPAVMHVGTFVDNRFTITENIGLPLPAPLHFNTVEDLSTFVSGIYPMHAQGVLVMSDRGFYKVMSQQYKFLYDVRANQPNIILRYLELLTGGEEDYAKHEVFLQLYPEFATRFADVDTRINLLARKIHNAYMRRYVQKNLTFLPQHQFLFMTKVHENFKATKILTTLERVRYLLLKESALTIYKMMNYN